jgi:hypothetical protein
MTYKKKMDKSSSSNSDEVVIAHELPSDDRNPNKRVLDELYDMYKSLYDDHNLTKKRLVDNEKESTIFRDEQREINKNFEIKKAIDTREHDRYLANLNESKLELVNTVSSFRAIVHDSEANIGRQFVDLNKDKDCIHMFFIIVVIATLVTFICAAITNEHFIEIKKMSSIIKK